MHFHPLMNTDMNIENKQGKKRFPYLFFLLITICCIMFQQTPVHCQAYPPCPVNMDAGLVTLQLRDRHRFQFAGYYAAVEKCYYQKNGIQLHLREGNLQIDPVSEVISKKADFGVEGADICAHRISGKPVVLVASIFQHAVKKLIVRYDKDILTPHDLIRHPVHIGDSRLFYALFQREGIPFSRIMETPSEKPLYDFIEGRISAYVGNVNTDPFLLRRAGIHFRIIDPAIYGFDFYGDSLFTTEEFIRKNPELIGKFKFATLEGWRYAMENVDEMVDIIQTRYRPDKSREELLDEARVLQKIIQPELIRIGHMNPDRWKWIAGVLARQEKGDMERFSGFLYDPETIHDGRGLLKILVILVACAFALGMGFLVLSFFNYKLREKVKEQTLNLRKSEARNRALVESIRDSLFLIDPAGRFIEVNTSAVRMFECPRERMLGSHIYDFSPPYQPDGRLSIEAAQEHMDAVCKGYSRNFEWVHKKLNGTEFFAEVTLSLVEVEKDILLFAVVRDITHRKLYESALKEREQQYRDLFENSLVGLWRTRIKDGVFMHANLKTAQILGYASVRELAENWSKDFYPPGVREDFVDALINSDSPVAIETRFTLADNTTKDVAVHAKAYPEKGYMEGVLMDISDKKKAIQLAQEAFELSRDILYKLNLKTLKYEYLSPVFKIITKYGEDRVLSLGLNGFLDVVHPDDVHILDTHHEQILNSTPDQTTEYTIEYRVKDVEGKYIWLSDRHITLFDSHGRPEFVVGNARDITWIKKEEKKRIETEEKYRNLFESSPDGIAITDLEGNILETNRGFQKLLGYTQKELEKMNYHDFTPHEYHAREKQHIEMMKAGLSPNRPYEKEYIRKDNTRIPVSLIGWMVKDAKSNIIAMGAFVKDNRKEKELAEEKNALEEQLRQIQKMEAIGTLAGGIAHDFNNILGGIIGYTELLKEVLPDEEEKGQAYLKQIEQAGQRAKELVRQILKFSRQNSTAFKPLEIRMIVKEALRLMRSTLPRNIELEEDIRGEGESTMADPTQVHQVVMNLCTNAYHAMKATGGRLRVELSSVDFARTTTIGARELPPGRYLRLTVSDTGRGISREILPKIFDPYFTTKRREEGTGLGLSVTLGIVKNHGGSIDVKSTPSEGAVFRVYFPLMEIMDTDVVEEEKPEKGGDEHILFVDDEPFFVDIVRQMLEKLGYRVKAVQSSMEAYELFQADPYAYDLVITDQTMPRLTGVELAGMMREIRKDIPIVLCTGFSDTVNRESAPGFGITRFVLKPVSRKELAAAIREVLDNPDGQAPEKMDEDL